MSWAIRMMTASLALVVLPSVLASSGGGPRILFQSLAPGGGDTLYTMNPDGSDVRQLGLHVSGDAISPDWSPDGRQVTFSLQVGDAQSIWTADADGANATELFHCAGPCLGADYPAWSPDGKSIAFTYYNATPPPTSGPPSGDSIRVIDLASKRVRIVATSKLPQLIDLARWSPDGTRMVAERDRFANGNETGCRIEIIRVRDGNATPITPFSRLAFHPDWSRGNLITFDTYDLLAYRETAPGASNLFTVQPDGSHLRQLTHFKAGGNRVSAVTFTPDGRRIMFTYQVGRSRGAGVIPSAGGSVTTIQTDVLVTHPRLSAAP